MPPPINPNDPNVRQQLTLARQTNRLLQQLYDLHKSARREGVTESDLRADLARFLGQLTRQSRYALLDRLGLSRDSSAADLAYGLRHGFAQAARHQQEQRFQSAFAAGQKALFDRAAALSMSGFGGLGHGMAGVGQLAGGLSRLGFGGLAAGLSQAALPIAGGMVALNFGSQVARVFHDPFATGDQKLRALWRMLPLGETTQEWYDSLSGRVAAMELAKYRGQIGQTFAQERLEKAGFSLRYQVEQAGKSGLAEAYRSGQAVTLGVYDRGTAAGLTAYEDARRLLPYRQNLAKLEREMAVATKERAAAERELNNLTKRELEIKRRIEEVNRQLDRGGSGPEYQELFERHKILTAELKGLNQLSRQAHERVVSARAGEETARGEVEKARIALQKLGEAEKIEARADRSEASGRRLGRMNVYQRQLGLVAIRMLESGVNPDYLPEEYKQAAEAFDPESFDRIITRHGLRTAQFEARRGMRGFETADPFGDRMRADRLRDEVTREEYAIDTRVAGRIAEIGRETGVFIVKQIESAFAALRDEINKRFREARNT